MNLQRCPANCRNCGQSAQQIELVRGLEADRDAAAQMIEESDGDAEIMEMARGEIEEVEARLPDEMKALQLLLLPRDRDDSRNAILEVRAGTGGMKPRFSPPTCLACISVSRRGMAGASR